MLRSNKIYYPILLSLMFIFPPAARAIPAITCHCFTDRLYDPAHPAVADPYFLATTQNSFFATVFGVEKRTIVMKKQRGTSADDLWVAYGVAARTGASAEELLQARQGKASWNVVLAHLSSSKTMGTRFNHELHAKAPANRLAETVVDEIFTRYRLLDDTELAALRKKGATNQELIIATMIGARSKQSASQLFLEVKKGTRSWGALLNDAKIDPAEIPGEIATLLKTPRQ